LYVPNAFTPQGGFGDGLNEIFYAYGTNIIDFKMSIFNRWGQKLFETVDIHKGWNGVYKGNLVQMDVYVWKAEVSVEESSGVFKDYTKTGTVTVVR
jgi:gliding motility-associated-like protein